MERVAARRASSNSKFEDDYYGESIKNVSDYRQWLREQQKKQNITDKYDNKEQSGELKTEAAWMRTEESGKFFDNWWTSPQSMTDEFPYCPFKGNLQESQ